MRDNGFKARKGVRYYGVEEEPFRKSSSLICKGCRVDLAAPGAAVFSASLDGNTWYQNDYKCHFCGNIFSICGKRNKPWY